MKDTSSSLASSFAGKTVLVTGFTGFLGKVWVSLVLDRFPDVRRVILLARGQGDTAAEARVAGVFERSPALRPLRRRYGAGYAAFLEARVATVEGDCGEERLGLDSRTYERLAAETDLVVHFAGLVDFEPDPVDALRANTYGALSIARFAARAGAPLLHVSTGFVAGMRSGRVEESLTVGVSPRGEPFDVDAELRAADEACASSAHDTRSRREQKRDRIAAIRARATALGWPNIYTYTKGLAEHVALREHVATTIVRPTIVECARAFPFPGWNEGINTSGPLFWLLSGPFRGLPAQPQHHFDVVPVDTVARSLIVIAARALQRGALGVVHLASSEVNPFTFGRAIELTALAARRAHGRHDAKPVARFVLRHLDAVPAPHPERDPLSVPNVRRRLRSARELVDRTAVETWLPRALRDRLERPARELRQGLAMALGNVDTELARVDYLLELYRPFIHDYDYRFEARAIGELENGLSHVERHDFGFDAASIDWRHYWLDVQAPGLETWCFPLLRDESPPLDDATATPLSVPRYRGASRLDHAGDEVRA